MASWLSLEKGLSFSCTSLFNHDWKELSRSEKITEIKHGLQMNMAGAGDNQTFKEVIKIYSYCERSRQRQLRYARELTLKNLKIV